MLNGRLELHGVNAEKFAASVLHKRLHRRGATLREADFEDALSFLISELWRLAEKFDRERGLDFDGFAGKWLPHAIDNWYRQRYVDQRYEYGDPARRDAIAFPHSLNLRAGEDGEELGELIPADPDFDPLGAALERGSFDPENDWAVAFAGLPDRRDREYARDLADLRARSDRRVPGGAFAKRRAQDGD